MNFALGMFEFAAYEGRPRLNGYRCAVIIALRIFELSAYEGRPQSNGLREGRPRSQDIAV